VKLYKITYDMEGHGFTVYAGTQTDAKRIQKEVEAKVGRHNVDDWVCVEVPTDKPHLLEWLNLYATKG